MRNESEPLRLKSRPNKLLSSLTGMGLFLAAVAGCGRDQDYVPVVFNPQVSIENLGDVLSGSQRLLVSCDVRKALKVGNTLKPLGISQVVAEFPKDALIFPEEDLRGTIPVVSYPYKVRTKDLRDLVVETSVFLNGDPLNVIQITTHDQGFKQFVLAEGKASDLRKDKPNNLTCKAKTGQGRTYKASTEIGAP